MTILVYNIENVVLFDKKQTKQFMCLFEARGISKIRRKGHEKSSFNIVGVNIVR